MSEPPRADRSTAGSVGRRCRRSGAPGGSSAPHGSPPTSAAFSLLLVFLLLHLLPPGPPPLLGQEPPTTGAITGRVVDAGTLRALAGALVRLERFGESGEDVVSGPERAVAVDAAGEYRFDAVRPGRYRLRISRLGYVPSSIDVDFRAASATRLSLALEVEPVRLSPLKVTARRQPPFLRTSLRADSADRPAGLMLSPLRQSHHLVLDIRSLTQADVVEAVTLAETDLFRALQRTPGVTTRDDFTATLWTRGASWDQTRVYLEGMPLFNPTHAGWLFSAVNPDALGEAVFYPGARPARYGGGAAAVLDLRARSGGGRDGRIHGQGELSLASARLALDGGSAGGEINWMVAARRTYVDLVSRLAGLARADDRLYIPYDFTDVVAKVDGERGGWEYGVSGIGERDRLRGGIPGILQGNTGRWGNLAGRLWVGVPMGSLQLRLAAGETRYRASILRDPRMRLEGEDPTLPPLETVIRHGSVSAELRPAPGSALPPNWSLGFEAVRDSVAYEGPFSLLGELAVVLPRDTTPLNTLTLGSGLRYRAFWGENRFALGALSVEAGVRLEVGDSVLNGGEVRIAPRLAANLALDGATALSAGWSRTWQYTQDIAPVAGPLGPQLHLTHLWVLAQTAGYAAIRSDVVTGGVERWLSDEWLVGLNGYSRRAAGVEVPNPDSGRVVPDRDPSVQAVNRARGVEMLLRRGGTGWTGSVGYTLGVSRMRAAVVEADTVAYDYPAAADVRHALDAMLLVRATEGLRVGGAFTYGSGVPYTRLLLPPAEDGPEGEVRLGEANKLRTPAYASLDLLAEYSFEGGGWDLTAYLQLRNALGRDNAVTYAGSSTCGFTPAGDCAGAIEDRFERGIPRLPLVGLRFNF